MPEMGRVYRLNDADYRYGVGPLTVRVTGIIRATEYDGESWWEVTAVCKTTGYDGPGQERDLYVRAAALYERAPGPTGKPGRPRLKSDKLGRPAGTDDLCPRLF